MQKDARHRAFFDSFFPAQEKSYYGGAELPEPVERLARPTICMASTGDFGIDPITPGADRISTLSPDPGFQRLEHRSMEYAVHRCGQDPCERPSKPLAARLRPGCSRYLVQP